MNRHRFIVVAASAASVSAALATDACSSTVASGGGSPPLPPVTAHDLVVQYAVSDLKGYKLRTRTYNGRTYGPRIELRPGQTLAIRVVNHLPPEAQAQAPAGHVPVPDVRTMMEAMRWQPGDRTRPSTRIDRMNNPHGFNTTNLHVHGIETIPHLFEPIGTRDPSATMVMIGPGQQKLYQLPIPGDQPSGLYWYHPHKHGSVDVQVSGGMAGLLVVRGPIDEVPEIAAAREIFLVFQTLNVNRSKTHPGTYDLEYEPYQPPQRGGYNLSSQFTMVTTNGEGVCWMNNNKNTYEPLSVPEFHVQPGEVVRVRILNGTNFLPLPLAIPAFDAYTIGFDGVNLLAPQKVDMSGTGVAVITPKNLGTAPVNFIAEANRLELLLRAPAKPGRYTLSSLATQGINFEPNAKIDLAAFVVSGDPVTMAIPTSLPKPTRLYPLIGDDEIVRKRTFVFSEGPGTQVLTGFEFFINGKLYDETESSTRPRVGTCEEWRLENSSSEIHPFHIHVNSFELRAINDVALPEVQFWDTFAIPPKTNGVNGSLTIRTRFKEWYGKSVFHCHILPHEDTGMMRNILLT